MKCALLAAAGGALMGNANAQPAPAIAPTPPPAPNAVISTPERRVVNYVEGHRYEGEYRDGHANGRGTMTYPNGDRYDGEFIDGRRNGRGSMIFASGEKYSGEWREDRMTGRGVMSWPNGDRYEGEFIDGRRDGRGSMAYGDGGRYEGEWRNNDTNGRGVMVWANGQRYEGQWLNGNRHGYGVHVAAPGKQYQGDWRDDKPADINFAWSAGSPSRSSPQDTQTSAAPRVLQSDPSGQDRASVRPSVASPPTAVASAPSSTASAPSSATSTPESAGMPAFAGVRKRLAVLRLENKVKTPVPDATWQIGEGLTEMLTTELFRTGRFVMVERAALSDVVKEQELGQTGLVSRETVTKVGELLGAQLLVTGAVTEFEASAGGGGGGLGIRGFSLAVRTNSAHVAVDIRLVDSTSGQILKSFNAAAKAEESGLAFGVERRGMTFGSDAFQKTPLGQATREAIAKAVNFIATEMDRVVWIGRVVQVKERDVYVNAGTNMNLRPGLALDAFVKGEELRDPATGLSLGSRDALVGVVTLTQVEDRFSIGTFQGNGSLKRGDILKMK